MAAISQSSLLRPPIRTKKPHISKLKDGAWMCAGSNFGGAGWTPQSAYRVWLWNVMSRGADAFHRLGVTKGY